MKTNKVTTDAAIGATSPALAGSGCSALCFTAAECSHLLSLLEENARQGWYYGNRDQYWTRHGRIKDKIMAYIREPNGKVSE